MEPLVSFLYEEGQHPMRGCLRWGSEHRTNVIGGIDSHDYQVHPILYCGRVGRR